MIWFIAYSILLSKRCFLFSVENGSSLLFAKNFPSLKCMALILKIGCVRLLSNATGQLRERHLYGTLHIDYIKKINIFDKVSYLLNNRDFNDARALRDRR